MSATMALGGQYSLEVKICGVMLVLPFTHLSTVEEVAAAGYDEYNALNPRAPPVKLLCVRDSSGRILSGKLNIIKHQLEHFLDVQTEPWTEADLLTTPASLDGEYRRWQYWTARQLYEMLSEGGGGGGDAHGQWIGLLDELCLSPDPKVQGMCVKSLHLLRQKSQDEQHVRYASAQLVRTLRDSPHLDVVLSALAVFQSNAASLVPLSPFHAEELLMLAASVSLDDLLVRFPSSHTALVTAFNKMYSASFLPLPAAAAEQDPVTIDGSEALDGAAQALSRGLDEGKRLEVEEMKRGLVLPAASRLSERTGSALRAAFETRSDRSDAAPLHSPQRGGANNNNNNSSSSSSSSMSLGRLLSLLASDEAPMRAFALGKLHAALLHMSLAAEPAPQHERFAKSADEVEQLAVALFQTVQDSLARPSAQGLDPAAPGSPKRLFPKIFDAPSGGSFALPTATRLIQAAMESPDTDLGTLQLAMSCLVLATTSPGVQYQQLPVRGYRLTPAPTVQAAAAGPSSARGAAKSSSSLSVLPSPTPVPTPTPAPALTTTPTPTQEDNQWLPVVARAGRRWAKLLLTLSHLYDESLAEPFAFLAAKVIAAAGGWEAAGAKMDYASMALFVAVRPTHELVQEQAGWGLLYGLNFRLGLALDWAAVESGRQQRLSAAEGDGSSSGSGSGSGSGGGGGGVARWTGPQARIDVSRSLDADASAPRRVRELAVPPLALGGLEPSADEIAPPQPQAAPRRASRKDDVPSFAGALARDNWDLLLRLWSFASSTSPPSRQHRLLAMTTLANVSILVDVQRVLERVNVLAKLLVFLGSEHVVQPKPVEPVTATVPSAPAAAGARRTPKASPRAEAAPTEAVPAPGPTPALDLDLPLIRAAAKTIFNLTAALKRSQQKGIYQFLDELCIGGPEEKGGRPWSRLAQSDETLMFFWTSLMLTVKLDAAERVRMMSELDASESPGASNPEETGAVSQASLVGSSDTGGAPSTARK